MLASIKLFDNAMNWPGWPNKFYELTFKNNTIWIERDAQFLQNSFYRVSKCQ